MYKHLFGPVPSRRLGMSLGVDLVPRKVCSLDCVYCEVGKTTCLTQARKEYIPVAKVLEELKDFFATQADPDTITFSGAGEPTLNAAIGEVLQFIKANKPDIQTALLTNGTLFADPRVRAAINSADLVLPSLDAATQPVFEKINRPGPGLKIENCIQGLVDFRKEFSGKIWLEIFILPGYNDSPAELAALKKAVGQIQPDLVQLNTLDRPGVLDNLQKASHDQLAAIKAQWGLDNLQIIAAAPQRVSSPAYHGNTADAIQETIARRPCTLEDLAKMLGMHVNEINKYLDVLEAEGKVETVRQARGVFYKTSG